MDQSCMHAHRGGSNVGAGAGAPPTPIDPLEPPEAPQQFLNLDEEEEGEERRKTKRKKEKRKKGRLSPPFLDLLDPPLIAGIA